MYNQSIMQQALGDQWNNLPEALQAHYQSADNSDIGTMSIQYPKLMQIPLNLLRMMGILINKQGENVPTFVKKTTQNGVQQWRREISFPGNHIIHFNSSWHYKGENQIIEMVNPWLGLKMAARVHNQRLIYSGISYLLKFGPITISIPEWLLLGRTHIEERGIDQNHFGMDFKLVHPLFGQLFRYSGTFTTRKHP